MRDTIPNTGTASSVSATYTSAATPGTPTLENATHNSIEVNNNANGNPASTPTTYFALRCNSSSPADTIWNSKYVDGSGSPSDTEVWLTDSQVDALTITGLNISTTYYFDVKARNADQDETGFGSTGNGATTAYPTTWEGGGAGSMSGGGSGTFTVQ